MKKILLSILCACVFMVTAHATLRMPDITVTKITTTGVTSNVGFKVKDSNEWLKKGAEDKWTVTSTDTPVQGAIGEKDYSGFFFNATSTGTAGTNNDTYYYSFDHTLADINDPTNGIIVDPNTTGGPLLAPRRADAAQTIENFVIKGNNNLYVIIYNGKVYGTSDISKATKFEAYQLAYSNHNASCVQTAKAATCEDDGAKAKYHCTICDKYFEEEACTNETSSEIEVIPALGHDYQVVKDGLGNATWTWANDYSTATLCVVCTHDPEHNDNQETTDITSAVTTAPTKSETGVRTYTAKVTYNEIEYVGTKTKEIPTVTINQTLDDTTDPTSTLQVLVAAGVTQDITLTGRTLYKDGYYNTLCLPFSLTAEQLANDNCPLKGCTLMEVTGASLNTETNVMTIQLTEATALEAGKPYLIKWESGTDIVSPTFTGVTITKSEPSTISGDNLDVVGIFAPQTMKESDTNLFFLGAENKFYTSNVEAGANLKGYRCYFKAKNNNAKALNFVLDDDATGINAIDNGQLIIDNSFKCIENGRVVIIRNGKKYNVNGQIIK